MAILTWDVNLKDADVCKNAGAVWNPILRKCRTPKRITYDGKLFELDSSPVEEGNAKILAHHYEEEGKQTCVKSFDGESYFVYVR